MRISERIIGFQKDKSLFKFQQIAYGIIEAIEAGDLKIWDQIPSINQLKKELGYSGVTIFRGYYELVEAGLIKSIPVRGYFLVRAKTIQREER